MVQPVVDRQGRLATVAARPALVADLRPGTGQPSQSCNTVGAAGLAVIQKVIVQFAVAIDFADVVPGLSARNEQSPVVVAFQRDRIER